VYTQRRVILAKVAWSAIIGDARGSVGTISAFGSKSGPCIKGKKVFRRAASYDELQARSLFASVAQVWRSTAMNPYRGGWAALAYAHPEEDVFGVLIRKTGYMWFNRANRTRLSLGLDPILEAPDFLEPADPTAITVTYDPYGGPSLTITADTPPNAGDGVIIKASPCLSPGVTGTSNRVKILQTIYPGTPGPWEVLALWQSKFGTEVPGWQIFAQVYYIDADSGYPGPSQIGAAMVSSP
jgi:hypothetical protein